MTIKDAIFVLNCVEAHNGICNEAKEMAIKSLEAWEKVKTKIKEAQSSIFCTEDENTGLEIALILIDNQISEVEHGSHSMQM